MNRQSFGMALIYAGGIGLGLLAAGLVDNYWLRIFLVWLCMAVTVEGQWQIRRASGTLRGTEMALWHKYIPPPPSNEDTIGFLAQGRKGDKIKMITLSCGHRVSKRKVYGGEALCPKCKVERSVKWN